ncbi:MAG: hypothetical protein IKP50_03795 [Bacilli bacterium]|nr:hypothetical protein [Bacilli bacterium]
MSKLDMFNKEYSLELLGNKIRYKKEYVGNDIYRLYIKKNEIELLEKYLTELQAIKNANPTEALEDLKELHKLAYDIDVWKIEDIVQSSHIKQALLKAQEQGKALNELIKNHIEFVVEKDRCYFKIKNSKGNEKSFTSYTMLDFWKEVLKNE